MARKSETIEIIHNLDELKRFVNSVQTAGVTGTFEMARLSKIDIEMAQYLLDNFHNNQRNLKQKTLDALKSSARAGKLVSNGATFVMGPGIGKQTGLIVTFDGFHRCLCVVQTGVVWPESGLNVLANPKAVEYIDMDGSSRSWKDILRFRGESRFNASAAAAIHFAAIDFKDQQRYRYSDSQKADLFARSRGEEQFLKRVYKAWNGVKSKSSKELGKGIGAVMVKAWQIDADEATKFFLAAAGNDPIIDGKKSVLAGTLYRFFVHEQDLQTVRQERTDRENAKMAGHHPDTRDRRQAMYMIRFWNLWRQGKNRKTWQFKGLDINERMI